jgi:hypothetical protein
MPTLRERIYKTALDLLREKPDGIRYADLVRSVAQTDASFKKNTIHGYVWDLDQQFPKTIYKPARGLFRLTEFRDAATDQLKDELVTKPPVRISEQDFYAPFADWLVNDMEECTKAVPLGGNTFRDKWGTPDVIGKRESKRSDIIQAPVEIVSAEVKLEPYQLVTAFGQACAYCLFSHRSYLAVPAQAPQDEVSRLDSLCQVFGIGLVLFDSANPADPAFTIRVRPKKQEPDLFYANRYMKLIENLMFT